MNTFQECRERVSAVDVARAYGSAFDRRGWALCPFHHDSHASMSFRDGRFRCWSCGANGDSIDFTGRLFGLTPLQAVQKLNADFNLALPLDRTPTPEEKRKAQRQAEIATAHQKFESWRCEFLKQLNAAVREGNLAVKRIETAEDLDRLTDREALAIRERDRLEYLADELSHGTPEAQAEIYRDREGVASWMAQILKD